MPPPATLVNNALVTHAATFAALISPAGLVDGFLGFTDDGGSYRVRNEAWVPFGGTSYETLADYDFESDAAGAVSTPPAGIGWSRGGGVATTVQNGANSYLNISAADDNKPRAGRLDAALPMGFLMEREATNDEPNSSNFAAASFANVGGVAITPGQIGPAGLADASILSAPALAYLETTPARPTSDGHTASEWVKTGAPNLSLDCSVSGRAATPAAAGISWERKQVTVDCAFGESYTARPIDGNDQSAAGGLPAGARLCQGHGTQFERGLMATSLVPTSGAAVLRPHDICTILSTATLHDVDEWNVEITICPIADIAAYPPESSFTSSNFLVMDGANRVRVTTNVGTNLVSITAGGVTHTTTTAVTWNGRNTFTLRFSTSATLVTRIWYRVGTGPWIELEPSPTPQVFVPTPTASLMGFGSARVNCFINRVRSYPPGQRDVWAAQAA